MDDTFEHLRKLFRDSTGTYHYYTIKTLKSRRFLSNLPPGSDVRPNYGLHPATGFTAPLEHVQVASVHLFSLLWVTIPPVLIELWPLTSL